MIDDPRLNKDVPNETIDYLSTQKIGVIIAQGLSETYQRQPKNPVDFLGKWLLQQYEVEKAKGKQDDLADHYKEQKSFYERELNIQRGVESEKQEILNKKIAKENDFYKTVDSSEDLEDRLQNLANYLQEYTKATTAYVAKLVPHKNEIEEGDDDTAHINNEDPLHLDILHSAPHNFEFINRKTIESNEGIAHEVFKEIEEPQHPTDETAQNEGEGGEVVEQPPSEPKPQHIIVDEVVREPKIKYFKVPRLGSLLCIRLSYDSCLNENALDEAIADVYDCELRRRQQEIDKSIWEEQENKRREEAEKTDHEFEPEHKEWEEITEKEYLSNRVDF